MRYPASEKAKIKFDEGGNLPLKIARQVIVVEQDPVLQDVKRNGVTAEQARLPQTPAQHLRYNVMT